MAMPTKISRKVQDSTLSYFVSQLDSFDQTIHMPLMDVTWGRDIQLRGNVSLANESTSFTQSKFGATGSQSSKIPKGPAKPWLAANATNMPGVDINGNRVVTPLRPLGRELSYTFIELHRSQLLGQPIDLQQGEALKLQYQLETDAMVYIGDTDVGAEGLVNSSQVVSYLVTAGVSTLTTWVSKTPTEILADVNKILNDTWQASGFAVCPAELRIPPAQYSQISTQLISSAGSMSILQYLATNCVANNLNGKPLNILPVKWLTGAGVDNKDRMMAYTNDVNRIRFPLVPLQRQTAYYLGIRFLSPYIYGFGEVEFVYPETVRYADGI